MNKNTSDVISNKHILDGIKLCNNIIYSNDLKTLKMSFDKIAQFVPFMIIKNKSALSDLFEHVLTNSISIHDKFIKIGKNNNDPSYWVISYLRNRSLQVESNKRLINNIINKFNQKEKLFFLAFVDENDKLIVDYVFSLMRIKILPL